VVFARPPVGVTVTPPPSAKEVSAGYGELMLVEMPAIDLLASLGWSVKNLYAETFGLTGSEGRESETQVILTRRLHAALVALNPGLPADAYAQAVEQLAQDRSRQIAVNANREVYRLLKDGVKVSDDGRIVDIAPASQADEVHTKVPEWD
jgi:type I restriction enzyme R subunit